MSSSSSSSVTDTTTTGSGENSTTSTGFTDKDKTDTYELIIAALDHFFHKYPSIDMVGRMATINSYIKYYFPYMWFVGFYPVLVPDKTLQIGPYQGHVLACGLIEYGKGVCGTAAATNTTQIVDDVSKCDNYIACDDDTKSEIVVPVYAHHYHNESAATVSTESKKKLVAVLDIDASIVAAFNGIDKHYLETIVAKFIEP